MSISRIDKLVRERLNSASLSEAARLRQVDLDIVIAPIRGGYVAEMALAALALALRSIRGKVRMHVPEGMPGLSWDCRSLQALLCAEAAGFGEPDRLLLNPGSFGDWKLGLGVKLDGGVSADASGWLAAVNRTLNNRGEFTATPAAVFATCCAFAKFFSAAVLHDRSAYEESWGLDLAHLEPSESPIADLSRPNHLGSIRILGAGAIGSGFAYALWLSGWNAGLEIIDRDHYDTPNHETTMLVGLPEVWKCRKKAIALAELARRPGLDTKGVAQEVIKDAPLLLEASDVFVCAVDNAETRRLLDNVNCNLLINAGMGGDPEDAGHVLWSRHLPGDVRLSTRYAATTGAQREVVPPLEHRDDCSRITYEQASLAAPFIGLAAGSLLLSSCATHSFGKVGVTNYFKIDLLKLQARHHVEGRQGSV